MENIIPLWKSHYSIGRSILTLGKHDDKNHKSNEPDSIIALAHKHKINPVVLIEDSMAGFLEAYKNCQAAGLKLIFGWRVIVTANAKDKTEASLEQSHKCIILAKNLDGYTRLVNLFTLAHDPERFYYTPRLDYQLLTGNWDNSSLKLCIPFYDSFLFENMLTFNTCIPNFNFTKPVFFLEDNFLPFDDALRERVQEYARSGGFETQETKSIYYATRQDFKAWLTFKAMNNRSTLNKPELEHCSSAEFCLEAYLEKREGRTSV